MIRKYCRLSASDAFQGVQREVQADRAVQAIAPRGGASGRGHEADPAERPATEEQIRREYQLGAWKKAHLSQRGHQATAREPTLGDA